MKIQGIYRIADEARLMALWQDLRKGTAAFQSRVVMQVTKVTEAASMFPHFLARKATIEQFITDHRDVRYVPARVIQETVNLTASGLAITDMDEPHCHHPSIEERDGSRLIPDQPDHPENVIDVGCVTIVRHAAGLLITGDIPEKRVGVHNAFWDMIAETLSKHLDPHLVEKSEGGSITFEDEAGVEQRVLAYGRKLEHAAAVPPSDPTADVPKSEASTASNVTPFKRSTSTGLPPAMPVSPAACAIDDKTCQACQ